MNKPLFLLSSILLYFGTAKAQVPAINYGSAKTFVTGTAITPVTPTNTGGAIPDAFYGEVKTLPMLPITDFRATALTFDASGNLFAATANGRIYKISSAMTTTLLAGSTYGYADGTGSAAAFWGIYGMAFDAAGNLLVTDQNNDRIRKIDPAGVVTTFAGAGGTRGYLDGTVDKAKFYSPMGIVIDRNGEMIVTDQVNNKIRKITAAGGVSTFPKAVTRPQGITIGPDGSIHVAEFNFSAPGYVHTFSSSGDLIRTVGYYKEFRGPSSLVTDPAGNIYVVDSYASLVKKISVDNTVSTIAGSITTVTPTDGVGDKASFSSPMGIAYSNGKLYVGDWTAGIRTIAITGYAINPALPEGLSLNTKTGEISGIPLLKTAAKEYTITATNASGSSQTKVTIAIDIPAVAPQITAADKLTAAPGQVVKLTGKNLAGVSAVTIGGVQAASYFNRTTDDLYIVAAAGATSGDIIVTNPYGNSKLTGFVLLAKPDITYINPQPFTPGIAINSMAPSNAGGRVPAVEYATVTTIAGNGTEGKINGPAKTASLAYPTSITVNKRTGEIYFTESINNLVRKISVDNIVSTVAGDGTAGAANGLATKASFYDPSGVAIDGSDNIFVADLSNNLIRKIGTDGIVSTFAGSGTMASTNGTGTAASFSGPTSIMFDDNNDAYVTESGHKRIRKITPAGVTTILTDLENLNEFSDKPLNVALGKDGNLYAVTSGQVYKVTKAGIATKFGSFPLSAKGICADNDGNFYVVNTGNVAKYSPTGVATLVAGGRYTGAADGVGVNASFSSANDVAYLNGKLYVPDIFANTIREVSITGYTITPALPEGLAMDSKTGIISGMPTQGSPATEYTITAANEQGESQTKITLQVGTVNTGPQNITFPALGAKVYGTADFDPGATSTNKVLPITYTSYNTNVATIVNGKIHIIGVGTVKIVASQIGDGTTQGSADASVTLTVQPAPLVIMANDVYTRYPYIDQGYFGNSVTYTGLVSDSDIAKFTSAPYVTSTAKNASPVGIYTLNAAYGFSPNYNITYVQGKHYLLPPINNLKLLTTSIPCKGLANGSIAITAAQPATYTAKLTKAGTVTTTNFTTTNTFDNLTAGSYNVCVTITGMPDYQQCFDVVITEPKDLSVYSVVNKNNATVDLALNGGANYNITINGTQYTTANSSITLPLQKGKNKLSISAGTNCQGVIHKDIDLYYGVMTPFPNPMQDVVSVNLGDQTVKNTVINLYSVTTGKLIKTRQYDNHSGVIQLDVASLDNGVYSLHLITDGTEAVFKVIKK